MKTEWKDNYKISKFIEKIEKLKQENESTGEITFRGFEFSSLVTVLANLVKMNPEVPELERYRVVRESIFELAKHKKMTKDNLLKEIIRRENLFLQQLPQSYKLFTSISIDRSVILRDFSFQGVKIQFLRRLNNRYHKKACHLIEDAKTWLFAELPNNYTPMLVTISAKTLSTAGQRALDKLDFVRGIWNYQFSSTFRHSSGKRQPVNDFILGPIHTLHMSNGELATDVWWYEPDYLGAIRAERLSVSEVTKLQKFQKSILGRIKRMPHLYQVEVEWAFREYARALDQRNWNICFLRLWSILEGLTGINTADYKLLIRRVSVLFEDQELHKDTLSHLKELRNSFVHDNYSSEQMEEHMYQLKFYVDQLLYFHTSAAGKFKSLEEAKEFLDQPFEKNILEKRIKFAKIALKFINTKR